MRSREQNLVNLSMLIKVPVAGTTVEVIRQYIETQGEKTTTAKYFAKKYLLFFCRIDPETTTATQPTTTTAKPAEIGRAHV